MTGYLSNLSLKEGKICHLSPEYWLCWKVGGNVFVLSCGMVEWSLKLPEVASANFVIKRGKALSAVSRILPLAGWGGIG